VTDALKDAVDQACIDKGMPCIGVTARIGAILTAIVRCTRATRILELGTLGGYGAMCLARGNADARVDTVELQPAFVACAQRMIACHGFDRQIRVIQDDACAFLDTARDGHPYDLVFIDADKRSYPRYLKKAIEVVVDGGWIVADNVYAKGRLFRLAYHSPSVATLRTFSTHLATHPQLRAAVFDCDDGLALAQVVRRDRSDTR
jgi:caffeoyl-CoA O-methyltransferase